MTALATIINLLRGNNNQSSGGGLSSLLSLFSGGNSQNNSTLGTLLSGLLGAKSTGGPDDPRNRRAN